MGRKIGGKIRAGEARLKVPGSKKYPGIRFRLGSCFPSTRSDRNRRRKVWGNVTNQVATSGMIRGRFKEVTKVRGKMGGVATSGARFRGLRENLYNQDSRGRLPAKRFRRIKIVRIVVEGH